MMLFFSYQSLRDPAIRGDGREYLWMTHAMYSHASPLISTSDIEEIRHLSTHQQTNLDMPTAFVDAIEKKFETPPPSPWGSFASTVPNRFYAIHFWMYSLLAVPFYALTMAFGGKLAMAFTLTNIGFACLVFIYLHRTIPKQACLGFGLFLLMGSSFYLDWSGPEIMASSCLFVATIAMLRGETGLSVLLTGLGATQNPPLIFMIPFICGFRVLLYRWPHLAWPGSIVRPVSKLTIALIALGSALALLPYAFFQFNFGMPSLIAKYFNSSSLITTNRLFSLLFDLDQGMLIGMPGLFAALLIMFFLLKLEGRRHWLQLLCIVVCAFMVMAVPTLSARNWNAGCVVMLRYGYWLAMPLLALVLLGLQWMRTWPTITIVMLVIALQGAVFYEDGLRGEQTTAVSHSPLALWVYKHYPSLYNPDPEIFYERSIGAEKDMPIDLMYLYRHDGVALKLLRHVSNIGSSDDFCAPEERLEGHDVKTVDGGWQYAHPPFYCRKITESKLLGRWDFNAKHQENAKLLSDGWYAAEENCVWSKGKKSSVTLPIALDGHALRINLQGAYYGSQHETRFRVNEQPVGNYRLNMESVILPENIPHASQLQIDLENDHATSPALQGDSSDPRIIAYCLKSIRVDEMTK